MTPEGKKAGTDEKDTAAESAKEAGRSRDEVALDLMKFIAVSTGYGKGGTAGGAGFSGKPSSRTPEEQADALIQLFEKCRSVMAKPVGDK